MIFVDDNSPDESYEKITEAQLIDQRIKILRNKKNRGIFYSRFYGALQSKRSYVAFIDCEIQCYCLKLIYPPNQKI